MPIAKKQRTNVTPLPSRIPPSPNHLIAEVLVGIKNVKTAEETKPRKWKISKMKWQGNGWTDWTEEEDEALLKGVNKYGLDFERIRKEEDGKVLADRSPLALRNRLRRQYPEKYKELRAATAWKKAPWTAEEDTALKKGVEKYGIDWDEIHRSEKVL
eukprot:CAMPEP_0182492954 /NCGR_PEP_ID=MMETSP1321-20130603/2001_1 /TAXON_ID=91990 /ORGANISM="Bolidomonas sp., Strain RCC1657" /LENGTH=156 /DNA_ID=CAMNT_0024695597 /DNA_START=208 /DNA_END=675 /DNA_ORIENTATION=-